MSSRLIVVFLLASILTACASPVQPALPSPTSMPPSPIPTTPVSSPSPLPPSPTPLPPSPTPTEIPAATTDLPQLALGAGHTCVLTVEDRLFCWGHDTFGQLGAAMDSIDAVSGKPVEVTALSGNVRQIATGAYHTCALTLSGEVKCWGRNDNGAIGSQDGDSTEPVNVTGLQSRVVMIASNNSGNHSCALVEDGSVKCWGWNYAGQLGDGTMEDSPQAVDVAGLPEGITSIAVGGSTSYALTAEGEVWAWGAGQNGQGATGKLENSLVPAKMDGLHEVVALAPGASHICALTRAGAVLCWGGGDGSDASLAIPSTVKGLESGVAQVTAGSGFTCVRMLTGEVKCWGDNWFQQLGSPVGDYSVELISVELPEPPLSITSGSVHTCALLPSGSIFCWGDFSSGQFGDGSIKWNGAGNPE